MLQHRRFDSKVSEAHHFRHLLSGGDAFATRDGQAVYDAVERSDDGGALAIELGLLEPHRGGRHAGFRMRARPARGCRTLAARERLGHDLFKKAKLCFLDRGFGFADGEVERPRVELDERLPMTDAIAGTDEHSLDGARELGPERCFGVGTNLPGGGHRQDEIPVANLFGRDGERDVATGLGRRGISRRRGARSVGRFRGLPPAAAGDGEGELQRDEWADDAR